MDGNHFHSYNPKSNIDLSDLLPCIFGQSQEGRKVLSSRIHHYGNKKLN